MVAMQANDEINNDFYKIHFTGRLQKLEVQKFGEKVTVLFELSKSLWKIHSTIPANKKIAKKGSAHIIFIAEPAPKEDWIRNKVLKNFASDNFQEDFLKSQKMLSDLKKISHLKDLLESEII